MQQIGQNVVLFEDMTERELVRFDPTNQDAVAQAQGIIDASELNDEDKAFAHFWAGYFYAYMSPAEQRIERALELIRKYSDTDGGHHKQWVLDQVMRLLSAGSQNLEDPGMVP